MHNVNVEAVTKSEINSLDLIPANEGNHRLERMLPMGSDLPSYCKRKDAMCQHVDSTLIPNRNIRYGSKCSIFMMDVFLFLSCI